MRETRQMDCGVQRRWPSGPGSRQLRGRYLLCRHRPNARARATRTTGAARGPTTRATERRRVVALVRRAMRSRARLCRLERVDECRRRAGGSAERRARDAARRRDAARDDERRRGRRGDASRAGASNARARGAAERGEVGGVDVRGGIETKRARDGGGVEKRRLNISVTARLIEDGRYWPPISSLPVRVVQPPSMKVL